jgi:phosphoglycolate phosphatase-like HAD superfamily hydrolase
MASSPLRLSAVLWDVDGTLAETERDGHRVAVSCAFEGCGLPWRWDSRYYGPLLRVSGGFERLMHDMASRADAPVSLEERAALAVGPGLHQRQGWQPALQAQSTSREMVGLEDLEAW